MRNLKTTFDKATDMELASLASIWDSELNYAINLNTMCVEYATASCCDETYRVFPYKECIVRFSETVEKFLYDTGREKLVSVIFTGEKGVAERLREQKLFYEFEEYQQIQLGRGIRNWLEVHPEYWEVGDKNLMIFMI